MNPITTVGALVFVAAAFFGGAQWQEHRLAKIAFPPGPPAVIERCVVTRKEVEEDINTCRLARVAMNELRSKNEFLLAKLDDLFKDFSEFRGHVFYESPNCTCDR